MSPMPFATTHKSQRHSPAPAALPAFEPNYPKVAEYL